MAASPGAMQLRTLQTIDGLGPTASNTVVLAIPIDVLTAFSPSVRQRNGHTVLQFPDPAHFDIETSQNDAAEVSQESIGGGDLLAWSQPQR